VEDGVMADFKDRILRAAKLDVQLYEEVEADTGALGQAMGVVVLSSVAAGIGTIGRTGVGGVLMAVIFALLGWYRQALGSDLQCDRARSYHPAGENPAPEG